MQCSPPQIRSRTERTRSVSPQAVLKRISIELSRQCNLRCRYCYSRASSEPQTGLSDFDLRNIVDEAVALGAGLVSIVGGGEPLLRETLLRDSESIIDYCNSQGCYCYLYTNCTKITPTAAQWLETRDVSVVGKLNSLRDDVQDTLVGVPGASPRIRRGIDALLDAGLAKPGQFRLALETIICPQNYQEIPELWRWMRTRQIIPEIEIPTVHGRAQDHAGLLTFPEREAPEKYRALFEELAKIDREEFGFHWVPQPPFPGSSCELFETNCYINDQGGVQPCAGVDRVYGHLRAGDPASAQQSLAYILGSPEFSMIREIRTRIKEPCRSCDFLKHCYGCRGAAYQATGDPFAGDPICWRPHRPCSLSPTVARED